MLKLSMRQNYTSLDTEMSDGLYNCIGILVAIVHCCSWKQNCKYVLQLYLNYVLNNAHKHRKSICKYMFEWTFYEHLNLNKSWGCSLCCTIFKNTVFCHLVVHSAMSLSLSLTSRVFLLLLLWNTMLTRTCDYWLCLSRVPVEYATVLLLCWDSVQIQCSHFVILLNV